MTKNGQLNSRLDDRCRTILSSLTSHIAVVDREGVITEVNEAWIRFGRENAVRSLACILPGVNYLEICRRAMVDKVPEARLVLDGIQSILQGTRQRFELRYPCPRDEVMAWYCVTVAPLLGADGGAVICHDNVTNRMEEEQRFQKSEQYYRALIENILDIVFIVNATREIIYVNPAVQGVLGYATSDLTGRAISEMLHQRDVPQLWRMLRQLEGQPAIPLTTELRVRHSSGAWRYLEIIGKGMPDRTGNPEMILTSRDITGRRATETALRTKEAALQKSHAQLRALTGRVLVAEDEARRRISRELHDDLNQRLAVIALDLGKISRYASSRFSREMQNELHDLQKEVSKLSDEVRHAAHFLHPSILDDLGLVVALRSLCADFTRRHAIQVRFAHHQVSEVLAPGARSSIYRIVQECLWNAATHAKSESAAVTLRGTDSGLRVCVRDFGVGFDPSSAVGKGGLGLISIEERARLLGGAVRIRSRPGSGCRIIVEIPIEKGVHEAPASTAGR